MESKLSTVNLAVSVKRQLYKKLNENGFLPPQSVYDEYRIKISKKGRICKDLFFSSFIPRKRWECIATLFRQKNIYPDLERVLGFGEVLTEFAIAPIPIKNEKHDAVVRLGALANFIVTTYDMLIDLEISKWNLISRRELYKAIHGSLNGFSIINFSRNNPRRLMLGVIKTYFEVLHGLSHNSHNQFIYHMLESDILRLFDAEIKTITNQQEFQGSKQSYLADKSALPFVVMGLPGWIAANEIKFQNVIAHRNWLYSFGNFIGLIDDIKDIEEDTRNDHPNRVVLWLCEDNKEFEYDIDDLVNYVGNLGMQVINQWNFFSKDTSANEYLPYTLAVTVMSWLGDPRNF